MRPFLSLFFVAISCALAPANESRRLFDFTPVSAANPVVATIDGAIEIPLSELRAYRHGERLRSSVASPAEKRALLEDLLDQYLLVHETYRTGVALSPRFAKQMEATRTLILSDFMATRAQQEKKPGESGDAAVALADRLFEAATIDISNEAYDVIKRAARAIDATNSAPRPGPVLPSPEDKAAKLYAIISAAPEAVAVRYAGRTLSIHEILSIYSGLPARRPDVQTQDGFVALIKPLITPELMALEAVRRGIADEPEFQNKLIQNRNALLRFHAQGAIEARANEILRSPELSATLQAWYREHADAYATPGEKGGVKPADFSAVRERVLADFSVDLCERFRAEATRDLRKRHAIAIDDAVLAAL
ncbi:MAG: hypothetical protein KF715_04120 [Candidatus Didemnitutus sp.]|nr:hypothetical protein [Candidatus Didemnitutus sp.]